MSIPIEIRDQTAAALDNAIAMIRDVCRRAANEPNPGDRSIAHAAMDTDPRLARDWDGLIGALVVAQVTAWATLTAQEKGQQPAHPQASPPARPTMALNAPGLPKERSLHG